jgi:nicotinate-nucleotide adenylyltransferase
MVIFVPAGRPPHKLGDPMSPYCHRFAMLALATRNEERFIVSDLEMDVDGPTYTVDTMGRLRAAFPGDRLFFLLGSDSFAQITTWHRWRELPDLATLVVLHRPTVWGDELSAMIPAEFRERVIARGAPEAPADEVPEGRIVLLHNQPVDVSATELRRRFRRGERTPVHVDAAVASYAGKHKLYDVRGDDGR